MDEETRPVAVVYDYEVGYQVEVPYTDEEWEAKKALDAANEEAIKIERAAREEDRKTMADKAAQDPAFAAFLRHQGITIEEAKSAE